MFENERKFRNRVHNYYILQRNTVFVGLIEYNLVNRCINVNLSYLTIKQKNSVTYFVIQDEKLEITGLY